MRTKPEINIKIRNSELTKEENRTIMTYFQAAKTECVKARQEFWDSCFLIKWMLTVGAGTKVF